MAIPSIQKLPAKKAAAKKKAGKGKNPGGLPTLKYPGDVTTDPITGEQIAFDPMALTDTSINFNPLVSEAVDFERVGTGNVTADTLANQFMTTADYTMVDPTKVSEEFGDLARGQARTNSKLSSELALEALATELKGLQSYAPAAAALQRGEIAKDNIANQQMRDAALQAGDPNLRGDLEGQAQRARDYAAGRLPDSINDRGFELGVRSRAADAASLGGFGARSGAARKASELMSADRRIELSQYGDQLLTGNMANREKTLLAPTQYATGGSQIGVMPTKSAGQYAMEIGSQLNDKTIISSTDAMQNLTQQGQFKTSLEQETRKFNTGLAAERDAKQASLNLQAGTTNVGNQLQADLSNQSTGLQAAQFNETSRARAQEFNTSTSVDIAKLGINTRSNESQFNSQLSFNTRNSNADRAFQAANNNAGRQLEVAMSNRNTKLDVQKTNKTMIFQDQQARKAEAAANARAAMAERGANARAAMSASANKEALAANLAAQQSAQAFQLEQQRLATDAYKEAKEGAENKASAASAGELIARGGQAIAGIGNSIYGGSEITRGNTGSGGDTTFTYNPNTGSSSGTGLNYSDIEGGTYPGYQYPGSGYNPDEFSNSF